jgi:hypothetical protein
MANAASSVTGEAAAGVVTFNIAGRIPGREKDHIFIYVDYDKGNGTSVTMKLGAVSPPIGNSNEYQDTLFATATMVPVTATFDATGKYRFKIPLAYAETSFKVTFVFTGGTTQIIICDHVVL